MSTSPSLIYLRFGMFLRLPYIFSVVYTLSFHVSIFVKTIITIVSYFCVLKFQSLTVSRSPFCVLHTSKFWYVCAFFSSVLFKSSFMFMFSSISLYFLLFRLFVVSYRFYHSMIFYSPSLWSVMLLFWYVSRIYSLLCVASLSFSVWFFVNTLITTLFLHLYLPLMFIQGATPYRLSDSLYILATLMSQLAAFKFCKS